MKDIEQALDSFLSGYHCSQVVLNTFCEELGMESEQALRISCGFGGGMGCMGFTCGAVTGAYMVISLKYGKTEADDEQADLKTYDLMRRFNEEFILRNNSITCRELIGQDISTPQGIEKAKQSGVFAEKCTKYVQDAIEILEEII